MVEDDLAHTHGLGGDLHQFVDLDILEAFLQRHDGLGNDAGFLVAAAGADIGELLGLGHIDHEVVVVDMLADDLSHVDVLAGIDEELTTVLHVPVSRAIIEPLTRRSISPL